MVLAVFMSVIAVVFFLAVVLVVGVSGVVMSVVLLSVEGSASR